MLTLLLLVPFAFRLVAMGVSLLIAGAAAIEVPKASGDKQAALGAVVATGVFTYTASFGSTWLTVPC